MPSFMKILAIADVHSEEPFGIDIPAMGIDLVVSLGDVPGDFLELVLLRKGSVPYLGVNGNHDDRTVPAYANLHLRVQEVGKLRVGGFEGSRRYGPKGRHYYRDWWVRWKLRGFPPVDIFVAHSPMAGIHDAQDRVHEGFQAFREYVERTRPRLFLHGHVGRNLETLVGETRVVAVQGKRVIEAELG